MNIYRRPQKFIGYEDPEDLEDSKGIPLLRVLDSPLYRGLNFIGHLIVTLLVVAVGVGLIIGFLYLIAFLTMSYFPAG